MTFRMRDDVLSRVFFDRDLGLTIKARQRGSCSVMPTWMTSNVSAFLILLCLQLTNPCSSAQRAFGFQFVRPAVGHYCGRGREIRSESALDRSCHSWYLLPCSSSYQPPTRTNSLLLFKIFYSTLFNKEQLKQS